MTQTKKIKSFKPSDRYKQVKKLADGGMTPGLHVGFKTMDEHISFKKGYTTLIFGAPRAGKSQFGIECMSGMSQAHGTKNLVFMPEAGNDDELVADIMMGLLRKKLYGDDAQQVSLSDFDEAMDFLDAHYEIIPYSSKIDLFSLYAQVRDGGFRFHPDIITLDHWGWLKKPESLSRLPLFEYVREFCQYAYLGSQDLGLHTVLLNHTSAENKPVTDKTTGILYTPRPHPDFIAGGSEFFKNCYQCVSLWRPTYGLLNSDGEPYAPNEVVVTVEKSKPKSIGREGKFSMYFHVGKQAYYEEEYGSRYYSGEYKKMHEPNPEQPKQLPVSSMFDADDNTAPF